MKQLIISVIFFFICSKQAIFASISVQPHLASMDEEISIVVSGLNPEEQYTFQLSSSSNNSGAYWSSRATYLANQEGVINLNNSSVIEGSFSGIDAMELFWSLKWISDDQTNQDFSLVSNLFLKIFDSHNTLIDKATINRTSCMTNSQIIKDKMDSRGIAATIMYPASGEKHPTVLVLSGSEGGKHLAKACMLASRGFTAIALAYFNYEGLPKYLVKIPLEYFPNQLELLRSHQAVDLENLAVTGGSKGGELSLLLAAHFKMFKAVVAYVPSAVVWSGIDYSGTGPIQSSWTLENRELDYLTFRAQDIDFSSPPWRLRSGYSSPLSNFDELKQATIPVEKINGPILLVTGDDDQMWPSSTFGDMISARLSALGFSYNFKHLRYNNAGHVIMDSFLPTTVSSYGPYIMGGSAQGNAFASRDSWPKIVSFLQQALQD